MIALTAAYRLPRWAPWFALLTLAGVALLGLTVGAASLPAAGVIGAVVDSLPGVDIDHGLTPRQHSILVSIRAPRLVLGMLVGAALSLSGSAFQGVFRNPLAEPYLLGASAGAGLGATIALGFGLDLGWGPFDPVPAAAFIGTLIAVGMSAFVAGGGRSPATLLLAGIAVASLFSAAQTLALQQLNESLAREVLSWLFGQLGTAGWSSVAILAPYVVVGGTTLLVLRRQLDVLQVGDAEAASLGIAPNRNRAILLGVASLLTAAAVAVSGLIAFVGLVVPHAVRLVFGPSYRVVVPMSAVFGAAFLALVDIGARTLVAPAEMPVGVITAFVGAPFFAFILWRTQRSVR